MPGARVLPAPRYRSPSEPFRVDCGASSLATSTPSTYKCLYEPSHTKPIRCQLPSATLASDDNGTKILTGDEKSLVEVRRKSAKMVGSQ